MLSNKIIAVEGFEIQLHFIYRHRTRKTFQVPRIELPGQTFTLLKYLPYTENMITTSATYCTVSANISVHPSRTRQTYLNHGRMS